MAITVQRLIEHLQGFPADSEIAIKGNDDYDEEFFLIRFIPRGNTLNIIISEEEEAEDEEE